MLMLFKVWKWSSIKNTLFLTINSSFIRTCKQVFHMVLFYFLYWWVLCLVASGAGRAVGGGGPPLQPVPGRHHHADTSSRVDGRGTDILRPCFRVHLVMKDMQTILTYILIRSVHLVNWHWFRPYNKYGHKWLLQGRLLYARTLDKSLFKRYQKHMTMYNW